MKKRLLFIRHGHTTTNTEGRIHKQGTIEPLDELGKNQANKLISVCAKNNVTVIFTSPEERTSETAQIIADGLNIEKVEVLNELKERNWGEWEGRLWSEVQQHLDTMSLEERYTFVPPKGESWKQMEERLQKALSTITKTDEQNIAIVTHGGALRGLIPILKRVPKETSFQYDFQNASVTIFDYTDGTFNAVLENDVSHLSGL